MTCLTRAHAAEPTTLLLTSDTAGHLGACTRCPAGVGLGGFARRPAAFEAVAQQAHATSALHLDAGHSLFGDDSPEGQAAAAAYAAAGYDAINLGYKDFRLGPEATAALVEQNGLPAVSCNLITDGGALLFPAFVTVERPGVRTAVIGVTERPAAMAHLPHLRKQFRGVEIRDPVEALRETLPEARKGADRVVVLLYGSPATVRAVADAVGDEIDALLVGGTPPDALPEHAAVLIAGARPHGTHVTAVTLGPPPLVELVPVTPDLPADPDVQRVLDQHRPAEPEFSFVEPERPEAIAEGANRALKMAITGVAVSDHVGDRQARDGFTYAVLDVYIENDIPMDLAFADGFGEGGSIGNLPRQVFLTLGGRVVRRLVDDAEEIEGHLPDKVTLPTLGATASGKLVFEVPADAPGDVELRLFTQTFAPIRVPLEIDGLGPATPADKTAEPVIAARENTVMSAAVYGVAWDEPDEATGMQRVRVDLRGRSRLSKTTDVRALDRDAPADTKAPLPIVFEYLKADQGMLQVLVDGRWAYTPDWAASSLPGEPPLLPDATAGGEVAFAIPAERESVELVLCLPQIKLTTGEDLGYPETLRFALEGQPRPAAPREALAVFNDEPTPIGVMGQRLTDTFAGEAAGDGRRFLVLEMSARNDSGEGGMFNIGSRFSVSAAENSGGLSPHAVALPGGARVLEPMWLPPGERRTFLLVFAVPEATEAVTLSYRGVSVAASVDLTLGPGVPPPPVVTDAPPRTIEPEATAERATPTESPPRDAAAAPFATRPAATAAVVVPAALGQTIELNAQGHNAGVTLTVRGAEFLENYGKSQTAPSDGTRWLALDLAFERHAVPPGADDPGPYQIDVLGNVLMGVVDGRKLVSVVRVRDAEEKLPWKLDLENPGDALEGRVVFEVPGDGLASFDLYLIDAEHGPIHLPLLPLQNRPPPDAPVLGPQQNGVAEVAVYGYDLRDEFNGHRHSRSDNVWLVFDLRGRSLLRSASTDAEVPPHGVPLHWRGWDQRNQLVFDGNHPVFPTKYAHELPTLLQVLSGVTALGELGFEVQRDALDAAGSVELVLGFEPTAIPGQTVVDVAPLRFQIAGEPPPVVPIEDPIVRIDDLELRLEVTGQRTADEFFAYRPGAGKRFVLIDMVVTATAEAGAVFNLNTLTRMLDEADNRYRSDSRSLAGPNPPPVKGGAFWIPPGDRRSFTAVYTFDQAATAPRLFYGGLLAYGTHNLVPLPPVPGVDPLPRTAPPAETDLTIAADGVKVYPPKEPLGIEGVGLTGQQVNSAIDRGRDFLWQHLRDSHRTVGAHSYDLPAMLALVHCDAHKRYPEFDRALRQYLQQVEPQEHTSYQNGLLAMLIESYGDAAFIPQLEQAARWIVEAQGEDGSWSYTAPVPDRFFPAPDPPEPDDADAALRVVGGHAIERPDVPDTPLLRTQSWELGKDGDNSTSQFALLGLWSAARAGFEVDPNVWRRALAISTERQNNATKPDGFGGWGYVGSGSSYGSMTGAGICSTALALSHLAPGLAARDDLRIRNGVSWLARHFTVEENPEKKEEWEYYYIYSLERVGQILGVDFIGEYEWYPLGARSLIDRQRKDGAWVGKGTEGDPRIATAFALLFLTRATPTLDAAPEAQPTGPGQLVTSVTLPNRTPHVYLILDASGSMMAEVDGTPKFEIAVDAVKRMVDVLPDDARVALRVYGHRQRAIQPGADEDSELVLDWQPLDRAAFTATLDALRPRGKTPLALSLREAKSDLPRGDDQLVVILLTDGGEDSGGAPVEAATELGGALKTKGRFYLVGFDINRPAWVEQLQAMAAAAEGSYWPVRQAAALTTSLEAIVYPRPPAFTLTAVDGDRPLGEHAFGGEPIELEPGPYRLDADYLGHPFEAEFWINPEATTRVELNAADLVPTDHFAAGRAPDERAAPVVDDDAAAPAERPRFCTQCGEALGPAVKFCTSCGQRVEP